MNEVVPGGSTAVRPMVSNLLYAVFRKSLGVCAPMRGFAWLTATALLATCTLQAPGQAAAAAPAAAPQVITVQVPSQAGANPAGTTPNWNGTTPQSNTNGTQNAQGNNPNGNDTKNGTDRDTNAADRNQQQRTSAETPTPTEFQVMVQQTLGVPLPIFGSGLFVNAPSTFAPIGDAQVPQDYVIGPGDEIRVSATGQFNRQGTFTVDRAGSITIPEVGALTVSGLQFRELRPFLQQQIGRIYRNFELSVTLGQIHSIQIYILGETPRPGAYTVSSLATMVNALFASGGVRSQGSLRRIELRRGGRTISTLDLYDLLLHGDKSKDMKLQPGDILFVPTVGPQVAVVGSVVDSGIYELRDETTLGQLLTLAHGLSPTATGTSARVESIYNHMQRSIRDIDLKTSNSLEIHGGDIVTIASISDQYKNAVTLRGNVTAPGRYVWHEGMRLLDLIPNREALVTRNYYRTLNQLGLPVQNYQPQQGVLQPGTSPTGGTGGSRTDSPTPTAAQSSNANGSGTTIGDALTQNSGTFTPTNTVVLEAPDVDLAYAVIERLDPAALTTSLIPFNPGALLNGDASQNLMLQPGDTITIFSKADIRVPQAQQTRFVRLEGEFVGAGVYSVQPGETLRSLIQRAGGLSGDAYLYASEFTRQSTRRVEQQRLREYADSLEAQINTQIGNSVGSALDPGGAAQAANAEAQSARDAVGRIRRMEATGRIVLKMTPTAAGLDSIPDIPLEDGDRFIVPRQPTSVAVSGEVYNAASFLFLSKEQVRDYLRDAGGPTRTADKKRMFVVRADGSVVSKQYSDVEKAGVLPGDTVVVPPQINHRNLMRDIIAISSVLSAVALPLSVLAIIK